MFRRESVSEMSSEHDGTFNFNYEIDITQKKQKTGSIFNRDDGFEFDEFQNLKDDKTNKSQKTTNKKILPSEVWKKSQDSYMMPAENTVDLDRRTFQKKGGSVIDQVPQLENSYEKTNYMQSYKSPKFNPLQSDQVKPFQTISQAIIGKYQNKKTLKIPEEDLQYAQKQSGATSLHATTFKRNKAENQKEDITYGAEEQYMDLCSKMKFYQEQSDKLDYEGSKIIENMKFIEGQLSNPIFDYQFQKTSEQTHELNNQIEEQRSIEKCLVDTLKNLEDQFEKLSISINSMHFKRQSLLRDDSKAILDEINCLKSEFQSLKRDDGSLNLSSTMQNPLGGGVSQERFQSQAMPTFCPEQILFNQFIEQIKEQQRKSGDPKYLYNIKMLFVRQEWTIFNNSEICIHVSYRKFPQIELRIGNKTLKQIDQIRLQENGKTILDHNILASKSFYIHTYNFPIKTSLAKPFVKYEFSYQKQSYIKLFVPTTVLQMGQFIPLTIQQYLHQKKFHQNTLFQTLTGEHPIDKSLVKSVEECSVYYPNLLHAEGECFGVWRGEGGTQGALVRIWQTVELLGVEIKGNGGENLLGKCLLFLFSK